MSLRLRNFLQEQGCIFIPESRFIPTRTTTAPADILSEAEFEGIKASHTIHELGYMSNICPDYTELISCGILKRIEDINAEIEGADGERREELVAMREALEAVSEFAYKYMEEADRCGRADITQVLRQVPDYGATTLREAMQFFRIIHFALWCEGDYHNIAGRLDQLFYPYYLSDIKAGRLTRESALELVCDFFLTFNVDSGLYVGMQQGDNGQSIVLGGRDADGNDMFNEMSELMLEASLELKLIDPKINLRVDSNTPLERFELATKLTAVGIGFPQYANDDVVIPALERYGYSREDAANYVCAACWEFICPGVGTDIPNIDAISLLGCVDRVMRESAGEDTGYEGILERVREKIRREIDGITRSHDNVWFYPAPLLSSITKQKEGWRDISHGLRYSNYGIHGTGIAPAADALSALRHIVFEEGKMTLAEFVEALDANYDGYESIRYEIIHNTPRMGNDREADELGATLSGWFSDALEGKRNDRGGVWRAGTASAMYYIRHADELGATADGRVKGDYLPANYSPSLNTKLRGPMSLIRSFTLPDLSRAMNGGPLTLEFSPSSVKTDEGRTKLALLVQSYIESGGHQLQFNVIDTESLLDAQKNPERYKNLIVRVWGWSGYFVELDRVYQDQIIKRSILNVES